MANTDLVTKRIKSRKTIIDLDTNSKIKELQKKLVALSFNKNNNTLEYFNTLGKIKELRRQQTQNMSDAQGARL